MIVDLFKTKTSIYAWFIHLTWFTWAASHLRSRQVIKVGGLSSRILETYLPSKH